MKRPSIQFVVSFLGTLGLAAMLSACEPTNTRSYQDFLNASGKVFASNATTPIQNLAIDAYDWIVTFTDGSTILVPFTPGVSTNASGEFNFASLELSLKSGNLAQSCTQVCVAWGTGYEDYCADWDTVYEDYCADWDYDSYGNAYCADWDTDSYSYCADWDTQAYSYCSAYGQDCSYYYPSRDVADIASAYSEISYALGSSRVTTQSQYSTLADAAYVESSTVVGRHTTVDMQWVQSDEFITPLSGISSSAPLTQNQTEIVAARNAGRRNMKKSGAPRFGRNHPAAAHVAIDQLSAEQRSTVEKARQAFGATPAADASAQ